MTIKEIRNQYPLWATDNFGEIHFADLLEAKFSNNPLYTVDYLSRRCFSYKPFVMNVLLRLRNILVSPFGLKTSFGEDLAERLYFEKGSVLVYFHVLQRSDEVIVLEEKDKHLNFRIIAQAKQDVSGEYILYQMSTLVHINNLLGKLYFALIRPFHNYLLKISFQHLQNTLDKNHDIRQYAALKI
jgi:hypothetical protein